MIPANYYIKPNVYVRQVETSLALVKLLHAFKENDIYDPTITIFHVLIKYPQWRAGVDIFQYLRKKNLKQLRNDPKSFFFFDASTEGFSTLYDLPFFDILYNNCKKHNISPKKIIFVSSNMLDTKNIKKYNKKHNETESINVACFNNFEKMLFGLKNVNNRYELDTTRTDVDTLIDERYTEVRKHSKRFYYGEKYYLSLSRVNRPHRTMSAYELFHSGIFEKGVVSHNAFEGGLLKAHNLKKTFPAGFNITKEQIEKFYKELPLIADTEDFTTNHAMSLHSHLHWTTLFQVVNETYVEDWNKTSMFWSEKTFRAIYHMQPFIIWGQQNINKNLEKFGYKLYEDTFDYSFDSEEDTYLRWCKLFEVIKDKVKELDNMSKGAHQEWKFKQRDILKYNFKVMYNNKHTEETMLNLAKKIIKIANGH